MLDSMDEGESSTEETKNQKKLFSLLQSLRTLR